MGGGKLEVEKGATNLKFDYRYDQINVLRVEEIDSKEPNPTQFIGHIKDGKFVPDRTKGYGFGLTPAEMKKIVMVMSEVDGYA